MIRVQRRIWGEPIRFGLHTFTLLSAGLPNEPVVLAHLDHDGEFAGRNLTIENRRLFPEKKVSRYNPHEVALRRIAVMADDPDRSNGRSEVGQEVQGQRYCLEGWWTASGFILDMTGGSKAEWDALYKLEEAEGIVRRGLVSYVNESGCDVVPILDLMTAKRFSRMSERRAEKALSAAEGCPVLLSMVNSMIALWPDESSLPSHVRLLAALRR